MVLLRQHRSGAPRPDLGRLRDWREDIPGLGEEFLRRYADKFGVPEVSLSPDLVDRLAKADWPGNVRQLENMVARLVALSPGGAIPPSAFAEPGGARVSPQSLLEVEGEPTPEAPTPREQVEALERHLVARALAGGADPR
jgi:two-component system response regulator AtoC